MLPMTHVTRNFHNMPCHYSSYVGTLITRHGQKINVHYLPPFPLHHELLREGAGVPRALKLKSLKVHFAVHGVEGMKDRYVHVFPYKITLCCFQC